MDKFIQEIADALRDRYNKENNTNFKTYAEIMSYEETKRMKANAEALRILYNMTHGGANNVYEK